MSIFISFSGAARKDFAIKFLDFFNRYGLKCWYDQHELFLGDILKQTIIDNGVDNAEYCILLINKAYLNKKWTCEEAKRLYKKFNLRKEFTIFPILLDITKEELKNSDLSFILEIKYQFLNTGDDITPIGLQILNRILHDIASHLKLGDITKALNFFKRLTLSSSLDIYNALDIVNNFSDTNYKDKAIILICLTNLFRTNPYKKTLNQISYLIYDKQNVSFDMFKIVESIFLISASMSIL